MFELALIGAIAAVFAGALGWRLRQDTRADRQQAKIVGMLAAGDELDIWATPAGWTRVNALEARMIDELEQLEALVGFPGDDAPLARGSADTEPGTRHVTFGAVLTRGAGAGRCLVAAAIASATVSSAAPEGAMLYASVTTEADTTSYTCDSLKGGRRETGELPAGADRDAVSRALDAVVAPARLRVLGGRILLNGRGELRRESVEAIAAALGALADSFPRTPGRGPLG